jgi:hypothetical protein
MTERPQLTSGRGVARATPNTGGILASMLFGFLLLGCRDES